MSQPVSYTVQFHIERIGALYTGLAAALSEAGFSGSQLNEIFSRHIRGECVQCGIRITGDDIARVALAEDKTEVPDLRLDRLRQGYCARNGCDSYYYHIHFDDYPDLDWTKIREKAGLLAAAKQATIEKETSATTIRNWILIRLAVGLGVVLILLLFWHIRYYGYVPVLQKPHKYTVDPASANHRPAR